MEQDANAGATKGVASALRDDFRATLVKYGTFAQNPRFGEVWVPTVTPPNWHPYPPCHWVNARRGFGLSYAYLDNLDDKKLEQVVQGYRINSHDKRADALMKTRGVISSLCFVEIKTPETPLLGFSFYRKGCWPASVELSGAISQTQGTVFGAMETLRGKLAMNDSDGDPTGEEMFNYALRSFLVVGNLKQFVADRGVNQEKLRSFELLRRNCHSPEIVTFDELYERARFIVQHAE